MYRPILRATSADGQAVPTAVHAAAGNTNQCLWLGNRDQNAIWWILGGLAVFVVLGIGAAIVIIAVASMSSEPNNNRFEANANAPNRNINAYRPNTNNANANSIANCLLRLGRRLLDAKNGEREVRHMEISGTQMASTT